VDLGYTLDTFRQSASTKTATTLVEHEHIVMGLGPVMTDEHLHHQHLLTDIGSSPRRPAAR
jgi:hypothetical protein